MFEVSNAYKTAIKSNTRVAEWRGKIKLADQAQTEISFSDNEIVQGSGTITRSCCGSSEIEIGTVYASELDISLFSNIDRYSLKQAEITLDYYLEINSGEFEKVPMGIFDIATATRNIKTIDIKAYDRMLRFDKALNAAVGGKPYDLLTLACDNCKVPLGMTQAQVESLPNGSESLALFERNDVTTYRDLLFYVAQAMACVAQINRRGELILIKFSSEPVAEIKREQRFNSSYSDFVTRYTSLSSTNLLTEKAEYIAATPDDGLTMNLGVNPLIQIKVEGFRERILQNILTAIKAIEYVPFDMETIGNPALDPGDCIRLSGGHADETKRSCITSITYKIHGKHRLKGVGKNPRLIDVKSKVDKNITGLLNQVEAQKMIFYDFLNAKEYKILKEPVLIIDIDFVTKEKTTAIFLAEILIDVVADSQEISIPGTVSFTGQDNQSITQNAQFAYSEKKHPLIEIVYKLNDTEVDSFYPKQIVHEGKQIITLFYPLGGVEQNKKNDFSVLMKISGGTASIGRQQIQATITGQGLVASLGGWDGTLEIKETFEPWDLSAGLVISDLTETVTVSQQIPRGLSLTDVISNLELKGLAFPPSDLTDRVLTSNVITKQTLFAGMLPKWSYNSKALELVDNKIKFRTTWDMEGVIDSSFAGEGNVYKIPIELNDIAIVTSLTIKNPNSITTDKYLLRRGPSIYKLAEGQLLNVDGEYNDSLFNTHGMTVSEMGDLSSLTSGGDFEVLTRIEGENPKAPSAAIIGTATSPQVIKTSDYDMSHSSILGVERALTAASPGVLYSISFDGGTTFKARNNNEWVNIVEGPSGMTADVLTAITQAEWGEEITDKFSYKLVLPTIDDYFDNLIMDYLN